MTSVELCSDESKILKRECPEGSVRPERSELGRWRFGNQWLPGVDKTRKRNELIEGGDELIPQQRLILADTSRGVCMVEPKERAALER